MLSCEKCGYTRYPDHTCYDVVIIDESLEVYRDHYWTPYFKDILEDEVREGALVPGDRVWVMTGASFDRYLKDQELTEELLNEKANRYKIVEKVVYEAWLCT